MPKNTPAQNPKKDRRNLDKGFKPGPVKGFHIKQGK